MLEIIRSPYYMPFKNLISALQIAHAEAKDNVKYLASLEPHFEAVCARPVRPARHHASAGACLPMPTLRPRVLRW